MADLRGAMTAMVTPFDRSGSLDMGPLGEYLAFQRTAGIDGVAVCGTNGEGTSLSVAERRRLLEAVLAQRGDLAVIAGTGANNLPDTIELTRHAGSVGADAALVLPPYFYKNPSAAGVAAFFRAVLDAAELPILLYSIPQQTSVPVTDAILDLLDRHPRLAGMKDSQGDWVRTRELITGRPNLRIFSGADELMAKALAAGSAGAISGTANPFPELVAGVWDASDEEDRAKAQVRLDAAKTIVLRYPLIAVSKSILAHRGLPRMSVRPPLIDLTPDQERAVISGLQDEGLLTAAG